MLGTGIFMQCAVVPNQIYSQDKVMSRLNSLNACYNSNKKI
jgi:hypothetical protein